MHVSLFQIYYSAVYPDESQLTGIIGQVSPYSQVGIKGSIKRQILQGLSYLASHGLEHGNLDGSNILLNRNGNLKISE